MSAPKRLRSAAQLRGSKRAHRPMRRLSVEQRRELVSRLGRHLPLIPRTGGYVLVGGDRRWRTVELWHGRSFTCGYLWERGHVRDARLVLPPTSAVVFVHFEDAA
jgi:hypothetical protein